MEEKLLERQALAVERFTEDEGLTEELTDHQATPLIQWVTEQAALVAQDLSLDEEALDLALSKLRKAVRFAAKQATPESTPEELLTLAKTNLSSQEN